MEREQNLYIEKMSKNKQLIVCMVIILLSSHDAEANYTLFNYTDLRDARIGLSGDSKIDPSTGVLSLTGKAVFGEELRVWDSVAGTTTDFDTTFSFVMTFNSTRPGLYHGDGFAFFLEKGGAWVPTPFGWEGCLGLITHCKNSTAPGGLVAVEFDSYENEEYGDPSPSHIGINVNTIRSAETAMLKSPWTSGERGLARVRYDSSAKNLSVSVSYLGHTYELSHAVNLSEILPERVSFGFSASTGYSETAYDIHSWSFLNTTRRRLGEDRRGRGRSTRRRAMVWVGVGCGSVAGIGGFLFLYLMWGGKISVSKDTGVEREIEDETGGPKRFSYKELARATNRFSEDGKLGEGGFGEVYRGVLKDGSNIDVAVKKVSKTSKQGRKEFVSEVRIISRLRHKNLVKLIGWCHEKGEFLLVYEFLANGSLDSHLFNDGSKALLSWGARYKIALGLAYSLLYLHEESENYVVHRDIKSSNVMLDAEFNAKLGDFGLARLVDESAENRTTRLAGTLGYMAPEYISTSKASKASDVFSFGVVVLEIGCGRKSVEHGFEEDEVSLVSWVWECYGNGKLLDVVDRRLACDTLEVAQIETLLTVGLWCVYPDYKSRPSINEVIQVLGFQAKLPLLPNKMPVPNYPAPVHQPVSESSITYSSINVGR